ncbi:MAG TPA: PspC domain-containing protein [Acidimicrobiia bacterium]|jgi:phage shock protein PspC (stress-responsive transcriptional regulator)|nr:PspC domain-containing protein [Acidimicrobiia bacterium]
MTTTPTQQPSALQRPRDDRVIAGVASGVARRLSIGTGWVRVGFVFLSFFGGLGFLLYVVGWLAMREEGEPTSIAENWLGDLEGSTAWIGVGLIILAGVVFLGATDLVRIELVLAAGLFLAGVLLYRGRLGPERPDRATTVASGDVAAADDIEATVSNDEGLRHPAPPAATAALVAESPVVVSDGRSLSTSESPAPPPPAPPRPPSYLGWIVFAAGLIVIGVIALLDNLDVLDPGARHYVAAGVLVVGLGLIVGSVFGRARGLIALGLLLMPVLFVTAAVRVPFSGEWGDQRFAPVTAAQVQPEYELSGGAMELDLRRLEGVAVTIPIRADLGIGEMVVWLPANTDIELTGDVGIGALEILGVEHGGFGVDEQLTITNGDGVVDLVVDLEVGIGALQVRGEG